MTHSPLHLSTRKTSIPVRRLGLPASIQPVDLWVLLIKSLLFQLNPQTVFFFISANQFIYESRSIKLIFTRDSNQIDFFQASQILQEENKQTGGKKCYSLLCVCSHCSSAVMMSYWLIYHISLHYNLGTFWNRFTISLGICKKSFPHIFICNLHGKWKPQSLLHALET